MVEAVVAFVSFGSFVHKALAICTGGSEFFKEEHLNLQWCSVFVLLTFDPPTGHEPPNPLIFLPNGLKRIYRKNSATTTMCTCSKIGVG